MPVTLDPEHLRALWALVAGLVLVILILAGILARRADLRVPRLGLHALQETLGLAGLSRPLFLGGLLLWLALLLILTTGTIGVIIWVIVRTLTLDAGQTDTLRTTLLSLAALTATLGALIALPFSTLRARNDDRQTRLTEDGLITDRINKAIEGLGAEKKVDRIGRPVTVWTGQQIETTFFKDAETPFTLPPRSRETDRRAARADEDLSPGEVIITYTTWPAEKTHIEWLGTESAPSPEEEIGSIGDWQVFSETVPNLEVRIGAILALERLARQNLDVHVQIMEILTAYIRENAKAKDAPKLPEPPEYTPEDHEGWKTSFADWPQKHRAALADIRPREDIKMALTAIGRRTPAQRLAEARWQNPDPAARFVFDDPPPPYPDMPGDSHDPLRHDEWAKRYQAWRGTLDSYSGYNIDLRRTNLCGADLARLHLAGARLDEAQMQGAYLFGAQVQGAALFEAQLQRAWLDGAQMQGASLDLAQMQGTWLVRVQMQGVSLVRAQMQGALLDWAQTQGASLDEAQMQGASLGWAQMQGASLDRARMQGASLDGAQMQGARLDGAQMQGASLDWIKVDDTTSFSRTSLWDVRLKEVDLRDAPTLAASLFDAFPTLFADASVHLPTNIPRPAHWPTWKLDFGAFDTEYAKWRASPATYTPPPPPTDTPPP